MEVVVKWHNDILDMDVSHHTGNVYFIDHKKTLHVIYEGEREAKQIIVQDTEVCAVAVDKHVPNLYLGSYPGLKNYDEVTGSIKNVAGINNDICGLFLPKKSALLYARDAGYGAVYCYQNNQFKRLEINIKIPLNYAYRFVVDEHKNCFFTTNENNRDMTKILLQGCSDPVMYNDGTFYYLSVDNAARVYGVANMKLYRLKADGSEPKMLTTLNVDACQVRFDKENNIIFGTWDNRIIKYKFDYDCVTGWSHPSYRGLWFPSAA